MNIHRFILKDGGATTLTLAWRNADGDITDVGAVTLTITDLGGNTIASAASTTNTSGTYTYSLANQTAVKVFKAVWEDGSGNSRTQWYEVVGNFLVNEAELRAFDGGAMASTTTYTDEILWREHVRVADELESMTGRSWIPRYRRLKLAGTGSPALQLYRAVESLGASNGDGATWDTNEVLAATVEGTSVLSSLTVMPITGTLLLQSGTWTIPYQSNPVNVDVQVDYGAASLVDGVDYIAMLLMRDRLVADPTDFGGRTQSMTNEMGFFRIDTVPIKVRDWVSRHNYKARF